MDTPSNNSSSTPKYRLIDGQYKIDPQFLQPMDSKIGEAIDPMTKCQHLFYLFLNRNNLAQQFVYLVTEFVHGKFEDASDFVHEIKVLREVQLYDDDWELKVRTSNDGHLIYRHYNCKCNDSTQNESISST
jgi:hypothetical protein